MIILAIICTLVAGVIGAFLEPVSFSVSLPIAVMGGFILYEIKRDRAGTETTGRKPQPNRQKT